MRKNLLLGSLMFAASSSFIAAQQLPITKPEELAGRGETSDGYGGMVGMNVIVSTHIDGAPTSLLGHQQYLDEFTIGLYQRTGSEVEPLGFSFFTNGSNGGATWRGCVLFLKGEIGLGASLRILSSPTAWALRGKLEHFGNPSCLPSDHRTIY